MADTHRVGPESEGERLDKYLAGLPSVASRRRARDAIDSGKVDLDGLTLGPGDGGRLLSAGATLIIHWNRPGTAKAARKGKQILHHKGLRVVHEDDHVLVVDKPTGLLTDTATRQQARNDDSVRGLLSERLRSQGQHAHVVHRIDRDTTGLVVVARTDPASEHLRGEFSRNRPLRVYWALVNGGPRLDEGQWSHPMRWDSERRLQIPCSMDDPGAVMAQASFRVLKRYGRRATALEVTLGTGRRNQIRLQCRLEGHPMVGERQYLDPNLEYSPLAAPRQALHAMRLGFVHPADGKRVQFESPLPKDLQALLKNVQAKAQGKAPDKPVTRTSRPKTRPKPKPKN